MSFDLAILGSGFAGSLLAMAARRLGLSVVLLERGAHPRFAIGESTSPLTNLLLEELALRYDLPRLLPFTSYGAWKRAYPEVTVGLKRGFTFYRHTPGERFTSDLERRNELMVAASPNDEVADTHWFRADFDHWLVREAQALGAEYLDRAAVSRANREGDGWTLEGERNGAPFRLEARLLVDATGPRGALSRLLDLPEVPLLDGYPRTETLFSHFTDVHLFSRQAPHAEKEPYPPDDAALHHVFPGGWMWVLRFENGVTSAGFAVEPWLARELRIEEGAPAWERFLDRFPSIREHFADAKPTMPFVHQPRLAYRCGHTSGDGWALLPSAGGFVDPLFSTGFPLTLLGVHRIAAHLRETGGRELTPPDYSATCALELEATARLVAAAYASFEHFERFADLSMLYFSAASYAEMARRLDRGHLAARFLLQNRPTFRYLFQAHCEAARAGRHSPRAAVFADLAPFNIAGLCDPTKRNWYGVDLQDVVRGSEKLETTPEEVSAFFARMGWS